MAGRFIKLYDKILEWKWHDSPSTLSLFIYLLLKANYKDMDYQGTVIKRGQLVTSLPKIATDTGLSIQQTRTALQRLISTGEVTDSSNRKYRIITVVKYDEYQNATVKSTVNQQTNNRQSNRQITDSLTPSIEYIENIEEYRNIEPLTGRGTASRLTPPSKEEILLFCQENGLSLDVDRFFDYYTSNGWKVGRNPMKDWKATVRNWVREDKKKDHPPVKRVSAQQYSQREYISTQEEAMENMLAMMKGEGEV